MTFLAFASAFGAGACNQLENDAKNDLIYYGGELIAHPSVYSVFWSDQVAPEVKNEIASFLDAFLNSAELDWLSQYSFGDYKLGRGSFAGNVLITPHLTSDKIEAKDLEAELETQLNEGALPAPQSNTIYMIYLPGAIHVHTREGTSCQQWCGYHNARKTARFGNIHYAVSTDRNTAECRSNCAFTPDDFDSVTGITSHELAETMTDANPRDKVDVGSIGAQGWLSTSGDEVGDFCNSKLTTLAVQGGPTYKVQLLWDNSTGGCATGTFQSP